MLLRKIGKTLRGQAKPYQVLSAAILGALVGFAPPVTQGPLYLVGVVLLLVMLNANLFIAGATAALCKLLALALTPVSFELGLLLVDSPLQPLFRTLVNAPVTAWMGFHLYITSGATVLAIVLGTALGIGYIKALTGFRKKMADVEAHSEKYADFVSKRSVRVIMWVLFGGKAKMTYAELAEQSKVGNPVRPLGIIIAVLVVALLFVVQQFAAGPLVTTLIKGQLEDFHGATVDVEGVDIDLAAGSVTINRLAMADPDALDTDFLRANQLQAKLSTADLLAKRFTIDTVLIDDATQGEKRDRPGVRIGKRPDPPKPADEGKSIEEWFEEAKVWRERLQTVRRWLEKIQGPPADDAAKDPTVKDRLRDWAQRYGYHKVEAAHLIEQSPTILLRDIKINKLRAQWPDGETLDVHATNISTHPALVDEPPRIAVTSSDNAFDLATAIAPAARPDQNSALKFTLRDQSIDEALSGLDLGSQMKLKGGTWQAGLDGTWSDLDGLDMPLTVVLENTTLHMPGIEPTKIQRMPIQFTVVGPMDSPNIDMDREQFMRDLKDTAGKAVLNQYVGKATGELKDKITDILGDDEGGVGGILDNVGDIGGLGDIFGGGDKKDKAPDKGKEDDTEADKPAEKAEDKPEEEAEQEPDLEDRIRDGIGGLGGLGGGD